MHLHLFKYADAPWLPSNNDHGDIAWSAKVSLCEIERITVVWKFVVAQSTTLILCNIHDVFSVQFVCLSHVN